MRLVGPVNPNPPATKIPLWPVAARIVRSRIILPLVCYGFIGANSNSMNSIRRAASSGRWGVAYAAQPGATSAVPPP